MEKIYIIDKLKEKKVNIIDKMYESHVNSYKNEEKHDISSLAWFYLDKYLLEDFNININDYVLKYTKNGKPYIEANIYFNISHSENLIAIIISNKLCAIDIECIKINKDYSRIAKTILNSDELDKINDKDYIVSTWTKIECYTKLSDTALLSNLRIRKNTTTKKISDSIKNKYYVSFMTI